MYAIRVDSFFGLSKADLMKRVERPARAAKVFRSIYQQRLTRFEEIESVPAQIRRRLAESFTLDLPPIHQRFDSSDGTRRYLLRTVDAEFVESVLIPRENRVTFCISSQIGCSLGCTFCLTGRLGLIRDLSVSEIVSQVLVLQRDGALGWSDRFSVVMMGMGEPLLNYDKVLSAIRILHDDDGLKLPMARITVSTAGIAPAIERLASEPLFPNLSISLTGVTDAARDELMPVNRKYPIEAVLEAVRKMPLARQKRVMLECVMMKDLTDRPEDAESLSALVRGMAVKVNLIPLNTADEIPYKRSDDEAILRFQQILLRNGAATFIRKNRGNDVSGACGQLRQRT